MSERAWRVKTADSAAWSGGQAIIVQGDKTIKALSLKLGELTDKPLDGAMDPYKVYKAVPAVYRCVNLRAQAVSRVDFELAPKGKGRLKADLKLVEDRLRHVLYQIEQSLCLYGAAYLWKDRNKVKLLDLRHLWAETVTPKFDSAQGLTGFERALGGEAPKFYTTDYIVPIWLPDPAVEIGPGTAPTEVAIKAASSTLYSNEYTTGFFERGGMNVTLLITDPSTSEAELRRLETWWKKLARGVKRAWEAIAFRKNVEVKQFGYPLDELAMPELKADALREIANAFGVPEYYLSSDVANFATAKSYDLSFNENVVQGELAIIKAALDQYLLNDLGVEIIFHPERLEVFQEAELQKAKGISELVGRPILTVNEGRELLEKEPMDQQEALLDIQPILSTDIDQGVITKNERRLRLGFEEVAEDVSEMARRQLLAQLSVVQAAKDAGLSPDQGIALALGVSLETLQQEMTREAETAVSVPPPDATEPATVNETVAPDGEKDGEPGTQGDAPTASPGGEGMDVDTAKGLLREIRKIRVLYGRR